MSSDRIYVRGLPKAIELTPLSAFYCYRPTESVNSNTSFVNSEGEVQIIVNKMNEFSVGGIYLGNYNQ